MVDFGAKIKAAEREVKAKAQSAQSKRKRLAPKTAWKKGQSGNPESTWKPGESGNPGGRMKKTPITDAMREMLHKPYEGKEARFKGKTNAQVLALRQFELAIETGDMRAAIEIADRAEGKTVQIQQLQGPGGGAIPYVDVSPQENEKRIAEIMAKAGMNGGSDSD